MTDFAVPSRILVAAAMLAATVGISTPQAQQPSGPPNGPPNALQGFSQNRDKPIKITSATLEVRDKDKVATFSGAVHLVQGDTTLKSNTLVVFYDDDAGSKPAAASSTTQTGSQQNQQIKRVEAKGNVLVVQKDQTATGETGVFDMRANTVTLSGNVVIARGPNVVKGDILTVNMTNGDSVISCGKSQEKCRVQALIQPGSMKPEGRGPESAPASTHETPRQRSSQPPGL